MAVKGKGESINVLVSSSLQKYGEMFQSGYYDTAYKYGIENKKKRNVA